MKTKLPEITMADWRAAERACHIPEPRPEGYIDSAQYAVPRKVSVQRAQTILKSLFENGKADRKWWSNGVSSCYVYRLKK